MRLVRRVLVAPLLSVMLTAGPLRAQQGTSSGVVPPPSSFDSGGESRDGLQVPVSLDRIREALAQPPPAEPLKGLNEQPTFRLQVQERQKFELLMEKIRFEGGGGPEVFGGRANYDMQRLLFPPVDNPRVQPYGAFNTGEILTLAAEAAAAKLVATRVSQVFSGLLGRQTEQEAREEVARALAAFQAAQTAAPPKN
jgi:hypothetical protein